MIYLLSTTFDSSDYDKVVVYKFHFTVIIIFLLSVPLFKYFVGPWIINSVELIGEKIISNFFEKLFSQIELLKKEMKELKKDDNDFNEN